MNLKIFIPLLGRKKKVSTLQVLADLLVLSIFPIVWIPMKKVWIPMRKETGYVFRPNPQRRYPKGVGEKNGAAKTNTI